MLVLRSLFFLLVVPGTVAGLIPYLIVSRGGAGIAPPWSPPQIMGLAAILAGTTILVWCVWDFAASGRGTLAPVDPPKELVVRGPYRYVRNPMYLGVLVLLLGQAAFFQSITLLQYTGAWFIVVCLIVLGYEEPALRRRFGDQYEQYCRAVPRWLPTRPAGTQGSEGPRGVRRSRDA
jgi:protein-S-isoprenylcysteine O-methyltransferase Ste14